MVISSGVSQGKAGYLVVVLVFWEFWDVGIDGLVSWLWFRC